MGADFVRTRSRMNLLQRQTSYGSGIKECTTMCVFFHEGLQPQRARNALDGRDKPVYFLNVVVFELRTHGTVVDSDEGDCQNAKKRFRVYHQAVGLTLSNGELFYAAPYDHSLVYMKPLLA